MDDSAKEDLGRKNSRKRYFGTSLIACSLYNVIDYETPQPLTVVLSIPRDTKNIPALAPDF